MGLRQHPGPLAGSVSLLGSVLLTVLAAGCTVTQVPTVSLLGSEYSTAVGLPTGLPAPLPVTNPTPPPVTAAERVAIPAAPASPPSPTPLVVAMQRAGSHYERGIQAMRNGDADQAEWEFDAALETLLDVNLDGKGRAGLLGAARIPDFPASTWLLTLTTPPRGLPPDPAELSEPDEPTLEAPALLGPEDLQAVTGSAVEGADSLPEPDAQKFDIPILFNDQVKTFIQFFQTRKWGVITRAFERASRYLPMMRKIFREQQLPEDLLNLAFIESAVNPRATSRARAAGIWQFIPSTARLYGMRTTWWLDERRDPEKSTRAAAAYLKNLYRMFQSWPLALAAYNAGEGKLQRAIERQGSRDFWLLRLPKETQLFVPAFMAMTVIAREPERYGFSPPPEEAMESDVVVLHHPTELRVIAQAARTTVEWIRELNPELMRWATPPNLLRYTVRIPPGSREEFLEAVAQIPPGERATWIHHRIRKGETPTAIARRYGVDLRTLLDMNGLHKRQALRPGGTLLIPPPAAPALASVEAPRRTRSAVQSGTMQRYTVRRGDTLSGIARTHGVTPEELRRWNNLPRDARLRPGSTLKISRSLGSGTADRSRIGANVRTAQLSPSMHRYLVKPGDTLWDIARTHGVTPEELRRRNSLPRDQGLRPGQELWIPESPS